MTTNIKQIFIFALAATGQGISGSDRIFIEFTRRWSRNYPVTIYVWEEGAQMLQRQHLEISNVKFLISKMNPWKKFGFTFNYLARIIEGVRIGLTIRLENSKNTIVYSASEFWMDSLPAILLKLRSPQIRWAAAWYQTAPNPLVGFTEGARNERHYWSAFLYWLMQLPIKPLINRFADFVLVNNELERKQFPKMDKEQKVIVVLGAVDIKEIGKWRIENGKLPKLYDAVFQGRFHPQKGVEELVDIWKLVVEQKPDAKLMMIGDGPLMENVKIKIQKSRLRKNIILKGYMFDGEEKYRIFAQSRIVVHPSFYDSGGMASLEAMAFGLPCIGFDLKAYDSYYPQGMVKVPLGNFKSFADAILYLLTNTKYYAKIAEESVSAINKNWSWETRANNVLRLLVK